MQRSEGLRSVAGGRTVHSAGRQYLSPSAELRAGIFYDGVTFKILSDHYKYEHWRQARLAFRGIDAFVEKILARALEGRVTVAERHLFMGVDETRSEASGQGGLAPRFEQTMAFCGVRGHYQRCNRWGEKGVDTALTVEMLQIVMRREIDIAVLVATDGDFAPLLKAVRRQGVPTVLLGFHLPNGTRKPVGLSRSLVDAATVVIDMVAMIEAPPAEYAETVSGLFWVEPKYAGRLSACA